MKKSAKGAAAAAVAGVLLLGGAGSLAYWTADTAVGGGDIASGKIGLSAPDCGSGWFYDVQEDQAGEVYEAGDTLVPGDVISKNCRFEITAVGNHLRASLEVTSTNFTPVNELSADLTASARFSIARGGFPNEITEANNGDIVIAYISVTFDPVSGNESQDLTTVLDDITVTAKQVHN